MALIGYTENNKQRDTWLNSSSAPMRAEPYEEITKEPVIRVNLQRLSKFLEHLDQAAITLAGRLEGVCEPVSTNSAGQEPVAERTNVPLADELAIAYQRIASITRFIESLRDRVAL